MRSAQWTQTGIGVPADSFRLSVAPIRANETYTLCLHFRRTLSKEAQAKYRDDAAVQLYIVAAKISGQFENGFANEAALIEARDSLVKALRYRVFV